MSNPFKVGDRAAYQWRGIGPELHEAKGYIRIVHLNHVSIGYDCKVYGQEHWPHGEGLTVKHYNEVRLVTDEETQRDLKAKLDERERLEKTVARLEL